MDTLTTQDQALSLLRKFLDDGVLDSSYDAEHRFWHMDNAAIDKANGWEQPRNREVATYIRNARMIAGSVVDIALGMYELAQTNRATIEHFIIQKGSQPDISDMMGDLSTDIIAVHTLHCEDSSELDNSDVFGTDGELELLGAFLRVRITTGATYVTANLVIKSHMREKYPSNENWWRTNGFGTLGTNSQTGALHCGIFHYDCSVSYYGANELFRYACGGWPWGEGVQRPKLYIGRNELHEAERPLRVDNPNDFATKYLPLAGQYLCDLAWTPLT